jgi:hypothetical protein
VRRLALRIGVVVVLALLSLAVAAVWRARGPSKQSALARAARADVTARVEERELMSTVVARGTIESGFASTLVAPAVPGVATNQVVTGVPIAAGGQVRSGSVVIEIDGRPVLAWSSPLAPYRDLHPGDRGPDVVALQGALATIGKPVPDGERGTFGAQTQSSVAAVYQDAGYPPLYTAGSAEAVGAAKAAADQRLSAAQAAFATTFGTRFPDHATADQAGAAAKAQLAQAEADRDHTYATEGVILPAAEMFNDVRLPAVVLRVWVQLGQPVAAGATLLSVGSSDTRVRITVTDAQSADLSAETTIAVGEAGVYQATCAPGPLQPAATAPPPATGAPTSTVPAGVQAGGDGSVGGSGPADGAAITNDQIMIVACTPAAPITAVGQEVQVTLRTARSHGPGLVVPATAVVTDPAGRSVVYLSVGRNRFRRVPVTVNGEADGFDAVSTDSPLLRNGAEVRVRAS